MKRVLPALIFLGVLLSYGVAEGLWTHRWFASAELEQATARLDRIPRVVGDWEGTDQVLDDRTIAVAELSGYVMRRYVNRRTGAAVSMLLVCGRPGPTAQHTPEVCYVGAGFSAKEKPAHASIPAAPVGKEKPGEVPAEFWLAHYNKGGPTPESLRIYWAWNATGAWEASARPRFEFALRACALQALRRAPTSQAERAADRRPGGAFFGSIFARGATGALREHGRSSHRERTPRAAHVVSGRMRLARRAPLTACAAP